jgi:hypothetical protein
MLFGRKPAVRTLPSPPYNMMMTALSRLVSLSSSSSSPPPLLLLWSSSGHGLNFVFFFYITVGSGLRVVLPPGECASISNTDTANKLVIIYIVLYYLRRGVFKGNGKSGNTYYCSFLKTYLFVIANLFLTDFFLIK